MIREFFAVKIDREELLETLEKYVNTPGVTGYEGPIRDVIRADVEKYCDEIIEDSTGNLIALKKSGKDAPIIMLCAHMDEIGFAVKNIDERGFITLHELGGIPAGITKGQWVNIHTKKGPIKGVIGAKPLHLASVGDAKQVVDVGAFSRGEVEDMGIRIGDPVTFDRGFERIKDGSLVVGRCFDDRMGCAVLSYLMKNLEVIEKAPTVAVVFTAKEEIGLTKKGDIFESYGPLGSVVATRRIKPNFSIILDTGVCGDMPGIPPEDAMVRLNGGPVLRIIDEHTIVRPEIRDFVQDIIEKEKLQHQIVFSSTYTDASGIQMLDIPLCVIGIPVRYIHLPCQIVSVKDIEDTFKLIWAIITKLGTTTDIGSLLFGRD